MAGRGIVFADVSAARRPERKAEMNVSLDKLRNIGIMAHIDAGKTTSTERILYYAKRIHRAGDVDSGNTVTDWMMEEQRRGITITAAAVSFAWRDCEINLIDTPGHVDFTVEVERSLCVLDGAVTVLCGVGGVEAQTETVWRQADKYHVPRLCFVNKLDRVGADFENVVGGIRDRLGMSTLVLQMPIGREKNFSGVIDLVTMTAYEFGDDSRPGDPVPVPIPEALREEAEARHEQLLEAVAEQVDAVGEKYISEIPVSTDELKAGIRQVVVGVKGTAVLCGSALKYKGIQLLMLIRGIRVRNQDTGFA